MKIDFKQLLASFLPAIKRFPYAFGLMIYFFILGSIQIVVGSNQPILFVTDPFYNQIETLKTLGMILLVGSIGIRIAFEELVKEKDLKLPFKLQSWYDHLATAILGLLLIIYGVLAVLIPSALLTLEIGLLWILVLFFLPFAPFIVRGIQIPDYLLFLETKNIVLGFFIYFLSSVIPLAINVLVSVIFRINLGEVLDQMTQIIGLIVAYGFGIPYFINQLPTDGNYEKDIKKQHGFFGFLYGTFIPLVLFLVIIVVFTSLSLLGSVINQIDIDPQFGNLQTLVTNGIVTFLVVPVLALGHFAFLNTLPLVKTRVISRLFHMVYPYVAPVLTLLLFTETIRSFFLPFAWDLSPFILLNLVVVGASGYLTFLYFKNKRQIAVRPYYVTFLFAVLALMVLFPIVKLDALDGVNEFFFGSGLLG